MKLSRREFLKSAAVATVAAGLGLKPTEPELTGVGGFPVPEVFTPDLIEYFQGDCCCISSRLLYGYPIISMEKINEDDAPH